MLEFWHTASTATIENCAVVLQKIRHRIMTQQLHFRLGPKELKADSSRYLYIRVHSSILYHRQRREATHMSITKWMDKQKVVYTYSELSFILKKERDSQACYNTDEPWNLTPSKISWLKRTNIVWFHSREQSNSWRQKTEQWLPEAREREREQLLFNGYRVSVEEDEKILEMNSGDGYTTMPMCSMPLNCTCTNGHNRNLMLYMFHYSKKQHGEGNGNSLQYSCLGNPMDRGGWQATSMGLQKNQIWHSD